MRHHFVDEVPPDREFSAGEFGVRGRQVIHEILRRGKTPIVVGGSGLYVKSLIDGLFEGPGADKEFREILDKRLAVEGVRTLIEELKRVDQEAAAASDPTKPRRIIRALEVYHLTGQPISRQQRERKAAIDFEAVQFGLAWERAALYRRIDRRCEEMVAAGLLEEVDRLERLGFDSSLNALNTVGYAEAFAYRRGSIGFEEMMQLFKQNSRRYAKRQLTWFRRDKRICWIKMDESRAAADVAEEIASKFQRNAGG